MPVPSIASQDTNVRFEKFGIPLPGKATEVVPADVDGDGLHDVVAVLENRKVIAFVQKGDGFAMSSTDPVNIGTDAFIFDIGDVDSDGRDELVVVTPDGVWFYRFAEETPVGATLAVSVPTIFEGTLADNPLYTRFIHDVNGDGNDDLVLPVSDGFAVFAQDPPGRFTEHGRIHCGVDVSVSMGYNPLARETAYSLAYPVPAFEDYDGDGLTDIILTHQKTLNIFLQTEGKGFSSEASQRISFKKFERKEQEHEFLAYDIPLEVKDLNGDGFMDVIAVRPGRGRLGVFTSDKGRIDVENPSQLINLDGWIARIQINDINDDGYPDLVIIFIEKPDVLEGLRLLTAREFTFQLMVYRNDGNGRFPKFPDQQRNMLIPLSFGVSRTGVIIGSPFVFNTRGDYNGDGKKDLLMGTGKNEISLFAGDEKGIFSDKPFATLHMQWDEELKSVEHDAFDLNGDGVMDVVLHHTFWDDRQECIEVFLSRRAKLE